MAHALVLEKLGVTISDALDYSDDTLFGGGHGMYDPEYQNSADAEGFADLVSATAWNYANTNGTARFMTFTAGTNGPHTIYDIEPEPTKTIKDYCDNAIPPPGPYCDIPGMGTEYDWGHAWWDFYTDSGDRPTFPEMMSLLHTAWLYADPWDRDNSHYADLRYYVPAVMDSAAQARFESKMEDNGAAQGDSLYP
jgi:hypothetical protein